MEMGATAPTPDLDGLLQEDPTLPTIPVRGEGVFLTTPVPARRVQYATDTIGTAWTPLLPETPKRARTVLLSTDKAFYVSATGAGIGMLWPASLPLTIRNTHKVYVMSADPAGTTLSHFTELWAD